MVFFCLINEIENFNCVVIVSVDLIKFFLVDILVSKIKFSDLFNVIDICLNFLLGKYKFCSE